MTIVGNTAFPLVELSVKEHLAKVDTIGKVFISKLHSYPDKTFLKYRKYRSFRNISYNETYNSIKSLYVQLKNLGLAAGDRVLFVSENSQQLITATIGCAISGYVSVPVCDGYTGKQLQEIVDSCCPQCIIISDEKQLEKLHNIQNTPIISFDKLSDEILYYKDIVKEHKNDNIDFEEAIYSVNPDDLAYILYQFNGQGKLDGVKLSHNNILISVKQVYDQLDILNSEDMVLLNMPLSLVTGLFDIYFILYSGAVCVVADDSKINTLIEDVNEINASVISASPVIWKKLFDKFAQHVRNPENLLTDINEMAFKKGICWGILHDKNILDFFKTLNIDITQFYGLAETSGPYAILKPDNNNFEIFDNIEVLTDDNSDIYIKGESVFSGYLDNKHPLINGWFKTGDTGIIDKSGNLYITGKSNNCITLLSGYKISPLKIERLIKSKFISQVAMAGEEKEFLSALVVPDIEYLKEYAKNELKIEYQANDELLKNKWIKSLYRIIFENINKELASFEKLNGFALLLEPFSMDSGELTTEGILIREAINTKRSHEIESIYKSHFTRLLFETSCNTEDYYFK